MDTLLQSKDEVIEVVHSGKVSTATTATAGVLVGGGLAVAGVALIPLTFGGSIALSAAGGAIAGIFSASTLGGLIASKIMKSRHLKFAEEQIQLDQQLTNSINEIAKEYEEVICKYVFDRN